MYYSMNIGYIYSKYVNKYKYMCICEKWCTFRVQYVCTCVSV